LPLFEQAHDLRIRQPVIHDPDTRARTRNQFMQPATRMLGSDDQPSAYGVEGSRAAAIVFKKSMETGNDIGIVAEQHEVERALEAFPCEVERGHESRPVVGNDVLRMVLHHRVFVEPDVCAETPEQCRKFFEFFFPPACALRHQDPYVHSAFYGIGKLVEDGEVVTPENR